MKTTGVREVKQIAKGRRVNSSGTEIEPKAYILKHHSDKHIHMPVFLTISLKFHSFIATPLYNIIPLGQWITYFASNSFSFSISKIRDPVFSPSVTVTDISLASHRPN